MSQIEVARSQDSGDVADRMTFEVDGYPVARLQRGESMSVPVTPGSHFLRARLDWMSSAPIEVFVSDGGRVTAVGESPAIDAAVTAAFISPETALGLHLA